MLESSNQLEKQHSQDIKRLKLHWMTNVFLKLLEKSSRESDQDNFDSFSQDSVINSIEEFR